MEELEGARAGAEKRMQELSTRLQENEYQNEEGRKKEVQVSTVMYHIMGCIIFYKLIIRSIIRPTMMQRSCHIELVVYGRNWSR
jgi:hypothetical protein